MADPPTSDDLTSMQVVMEESRRLLVRQEADLDTLRTRAAGLLGASSVVAGLVVGLTEQHDLESFDRGMFLTAIAAYAVTAVLAVIVLVPREWTFSHHMDDWLAASSTGDYPQPKEVLFHLADDFDTFRRDNAKRLARLQRCYFYGVILLGAQVLAWAAVIV